MDFENPSYFSVPTDEPDCASSQIRRKNRQCYSESNSESSLTRQLTPPRCNNRRELRNFFRSISSNSADSNQELLIMGEPRLSDMAPDLAFKHPSRSNSLKRSQENPQFLPLMPASEEHSDELAQEDEVFLEEDSARYTNISASRRISNGNSRPKGTSSPRRHSVGTFSARDRTNSVASSSKSFKDDFSQMVQETDVMAASAIDEHSLRHMSYPRKRCVKCSKGTLSRQHHANMDDILIVSAKDSEPANLWVDYFTTWFQQVGKSANRKAFKIQKLFLEDALTSKIEDQKFIDGATGVKLQLVVVCPVFLDFISEHPDEVSNLIKVLLPDRTLALLLGVTDDDLNEAHKKALPSYFQWQRQTVGQDQDEAFTKEFLDHAMSILAKIWKQQSSVIAQEKACFSVTPKKIRQGQTSVFIFLTHPLQKEDIVKISVERNGELQEVKSMKKRNPYMVKISVPENLTDVTAIVNILVEKNGNIIGSRPIKCESKLKELEQILRSTTNPVDFMCQTLGFSPADREHLDSWLVHNFQKNLPPNFNLLSNNTTPFAAAVQVHKHSNEEFPSLLHFAARFGLEKLAVLLLDCPGADVAYEVKNVFDMTPPEIADANGHHELSNMFRGYIKMNEVSTTYAKLKEIRKCEKDDEGYLKPNEIVEQFYKMCPPPRPVNPELTRISPTPVTPSSECGSSLYLAMDRTAIALSREDLRKKTEDSEPKKPPSTHHHSRDPSPKPKKNKPKIEFVEDKVQKELAEILMDFKNNVHSLAQVEKLVEDWENRNDVQKSYKEKMEQLSEMRQRYEKIQHEMKAGMKKNSPFERFRRLFSKGHKHEEKSEEMTTMAVISAPALALNQSARPISSLSTSSSGSSGRMSTISGCSVGDSGTHSDNEERKLMLTNSQNDGEFLKEELSRCMIEMNYTPVPIPKPVKFSVMRHFETIEENKPSIRPDSLPLGNDQFYIQFPPNGQPVAGFTDGNTKSPLDSPKNSYMNFPAGQSTHEYINYKVPPSS
ncbi:phosphoinositide 3-kinase adapter protein 1 isoform X2 [Sitophilus oryzae]|uniref:Phosphoinositide 3-kinase adapter protein 1 isoform X2 n=1 Tax=Sitophilus oryzae TaxID=7048 RepID=A0A6J2Y0F8_SITOR|nr:phosphoinositide 3-kinase adapter protein 1 isoform X2 [Sitophilus oryzae]